MDVEILDTKQFDKYIKDVDKKIDTALHKGAQSIIKKTKSNLLNKIPKANTKGSKYSDTLLDAIYYGKIKNGETTITVLGNTDSDSGTFRTKFFIGGTKNRKVTGGYRKTNSGIKYVKYKKPMSTGKISATDSLEKALDNSRGEVNEIFKKLI